MHRSLHPASALALLLVVALAAGCERQTCEGACAQYYGSEGCGRPSVLSDGTTSEDALADCAHDCNEALYTTTNDECGGADDRNYAVLNNQCDALKFVDCVLEQDYSEAAFNATCEDLQHRCPWFRW